MLKLNSINEKIFELIKRQFLEIMQNDTDFYKDYNIILSNEQQFIKSDKRQPNNVYIVVKFLPSSLIFGQYTQSITIEAVSEQNGIDVCRTLMNAYSLTYNLKISEDKTIRQNYTTPMVASNFNEMFYGYRSLFSMNGTFVVSDNSNPYEIIDVEDTDAEHPDGKEIPIIASSTDLNISLNTQAYFNSKNFTRSIGQIGTFTLGFQTYLLTTPMINKALAIALKDLTNAPDGVNTTFRFTIKFKNGYILKNAEFKLADMQTQQNIGEMPSVSLTFTN